MEMKMEIVEIETKRFMIKTRIYIGFEVNTVRDIYETS
jgi:hypothetical protein